MVSKSFLFLFFDSTITDGEKSDSPNSGASYRERESELMFGSNMSDISRSFKYDARQLGGSIFFS